MLQIAWENGGRAELCRKLTRNNRRCLRREEDDRNDNFAKQAGCS